MTQTIDKEESYKLNTILTLQAICKQKKMNIEEVLIAIDIKKEELNLYLSGEKELFATDIYQLSRKLKVTMSEFMEFAKEVIND